MTLPSLPAALDAKVRGAARTIEMPVLGILDGLTPTSRLAHVGADGPVARPIIDHLFRQAEEFEGAIVDHRHRSIGRDHQQALVHAIEGRLQQHRLLGQRGLGLLLIGHISEDAENRYDLVGPVGPWRELT